MPHGTKGVIVNTDRGIIANSATSDLYVDCCDLAGEGWNPQIRNLSLGMGATLGGGGRGATRSLN